MGFEKRSVQAGASALYVNLPTEYTEALGLEKGKDVVVVLEQDHIKIIPEEKYAEHLMKQQAGLAIADRG